MKIPKTLHFCWFGGNQYPELVKRCIESWSTHCPDYEVIKWDENNFDVNSNIYVKEAHENKKWAFVTDFVRLYALYHHGGVYLDADFEVLRGIDDLLEDNTAFTGYQEQSTIPAAIMGFAPQNVWIKAMLDYYTDRHFVDSAGSMDLTTNSKIITRLSQMEFNYSVGDTIINPGNVKLYPDIYFAPYKKSIIGDNIYSLDNYKINAKITYGVHHGVGSWYDQNLVRRMKIVLKGGLRVLLGGQTYSRIKKYYIAKKLKKN